MVPQALWVADFLGNAAGFSLLGMTDYMFDANRSLFLRLLSLFHGWLPFLLIFLVWKIGYDRRAFWSWTALAWVLLLISFFLLPPPTPNAGLVPVNINYVWGMSDYAAQTWVPPYVWFAGQLIGLPLIAYAPTHFVLARVMPKALMMLAPAAKPSRCCRCILPGASCAAACAASASSSPALRLACWRSPASARSPKALPTASPAPAA